MRGRLCGTIKQNMTRYDQRGARIVGSDGPLQNNTLLFCNMFKIKHRPKLSVKVTKYLKNND